MELLSFDMTSCYLCQCLTDLWWGKTSKIEKNKKRIKKNLKDKRVWFFWLFEYLVIFVFYLSRLWFFFIHCSISAEQEMQLLPFDLILCYLCQSFTDLCSKNQTSWGWTGPSSAPTGTGIYLNKGLLHYIDDYGWVVNITWWYWSSLHFLYW